MNFENLFEIGLLLLFLITLTYQFFIIYPYTFLPKKQISKTSIKNSSASLRVFSANILQDNKDFHKFLKIFRITNTNEASKEDKREAKETIKEGLEENGKSPD